MAGIGTIVSLASTAFSALGTLAEGRQAAATAEFEAKQREAQAKESRAVGQQAALERRREQRLLISRQLAVAAKAGGAGDPGVIDIFAETAGEGEYNVLAELYKGETRARGLETAAEVRRLEGKQAKTASFFKAGSQIFSGASSLYKKFGQSGGFKAGYG